MQTSRLRGSGLEVEVPETEIGPTEKDPFPESEDLIREVTQPDPDTINPYYESEEDDDE